MMLENGFIRLPWKHCSRLLRKRLLCAMVSAAKNVFQPPTTTILFSNPYARTPVARFSAACPSGQTASLVHLLRLLRRQEVGRRQAQDVRLGELEEGAEGAVGAQVAALHVLQVQGDGDGLDQRVDEIEVVLQLARRQLDQGDGAAARSALERALLLAPGFGQARRLLATITSG